MKDQRKTAGERTPEPLTMVPLLVQVSVSLTSSSSCCEVRVVVVGQGQSASCWSFSPAKIQPADMERWQPQVDDHSMTNPGGKGTKHPGFVFACTMPCAGVRVTDPVA